jgi:putative transposase
MNICADTPFQEPGRRHPSTGVHIYSNQFAIVFLTVTTEGRSAWLANEIAHQFLQETWREATAWLVGDYLLMPDHLHLFCAPRDLDFTVERWVTYWKRLFRRKHQRADWSLQSHSWHHRLRAIEDYSAKWHYVQENPVRKGLVARGEDWSYRGNIHSFCR